MRYVLFAVATALLVAGCGSSDKSADSTSTAETTTAETTTETGAPADGKQIFADNCGSCHTLGDAATTGAVGPNLDDLKPSEETVQNQVTNGGGGMPAFGGQLSEAEIGAVAAYVAQAAGG